MLGGDKGDENSIQGCFVLFYTWIWLATPLKQFPVSVLGKYVNTEGDHKANFRPKFRIRLHNAVKRAIRAFSMPIAADCIVKLFRPNPM